jgi:hypothetical protein
VDEHAGHWCAAAGEEERERVKGGSGAERGVRRLILFDETCFLVQLWEESKRSSPDFIPQILVSRWVEGCKAPITKTTLEVTQVLKSW